MVTIENFKPGLCPWLAVGVHLVPETVFIILFAIMYVPMFVHTHTCKQNRLIVKIAKKAR